MSAAINLMSVMPAARPEGQAASEKASAGFAALFGKESAGADPTQADDATGANALKGLYSILDGLGRKAAQLAPEGDDPAVTMEAVAGLATDMATAIAGFEGETGSGLVQQLQGKASGDGALKLEEIGDADAAVALADPMAAVQALKSVISTVTSAVRELATAQTVRMTDPRGGDASLAFVGDAMAAESSSESLAEVALAARLSPVEGDTVSMTVESGDAVALSSEVTKTSAAVALASDVKTRGPVQTAAAAVAVSGGSSADADALVLPFAFSSGPSASAGDDAAQALLARVAAVAADLSGTASTPDMALGAVAGLEATGAARRLGPVEPLIAPEDVARALAQGGQPGRDQAAGATSSRGAETAAEPSRFAGAVASQISSAEIGEGRTRIELSPRGLGTIEVEVTTGSDGALKVVVRAENPAVLTALREERDLLAQVLGGMDTGSLDLQSFSDSNGQGPQGDRPAGRPVSGADDIAATGAETAPVHKSEIGNGRLDIVT